MTVKRALISVSDKTGIVEFARDLKKLGIEIISTGGTKKLLEEHAIEVKSISEITSFPEILDGRVKTLHPAVYGGLLAIRDNEEHVKQLRALDIQFIDLVIVNLYPFKETIAKENVTLEETIENIDIGGPAMLRAAAKNFQDVTVVVDPKDYSTVMNELKNEGNTTLHLRKQLAAKVFRHTAQYDALIAQYFMGDDNEEFPEQLTLTYEKKQTLRYGENPHQKAAFYQEVLPTKGSIGNAEQLHGKELSYNNIQDANAALHIVREFKEPATVAVKHMNPCGVGIGETIETAFDRAYEAIPYQFSGE